ncbi:uncharacterized protein B0T15DRAFT_395777 [Chaetomium strumarium]|uniref:Uncharacterized protein n=1 Tax=Chaetomium strumarium TaxID=1170767 RepID=A0AAJ0GUY8_9PEZI|nr:hypothetical protein B0T15DRAFT_395777 [Chaetomium strumarium]
MAGAVAVEVAAGNGVPGLKSAGDAPSLASLSSDEIREIKEYEKLLRFRDEVVSGSHPRIKPSHFPGKTAQNQNSVSLPAATSSAAPTAPRPAAAKSAANNGRPVIDTSQSQQANQQRAQVNMTSSLPGLETLSGVPGSARPPGSGKPEIDPVLLEKSDGLIKAEIQLQRQRVERSLREQLEQRRRAANKASEQLAELDVADILAKAMSLVHATPPAQSTDDTAANASASSDSFDDNTFYSSRHDTPESNMVSRLPNESEDEEMREGSPYEPELDFEPADPVRPAQPASLPTQTVPGLAASQNQQQVNAPAPVQASSAAAITVPGLSIGASGSTTISQPRGAEIAGAVQNSSQSRSGDLGQAENGQLSAAQDFAQVNERLLDHARAREPPLVRAHDLSPVAPQPTHVVTSSAIAREPQSAATEPSGGHQAAPAQVAALRKQGSHGSSPESSPHGSRGSEKKKNKKKKRKADRLAVETAAASPYIKPEPRSASPLTPQDARPSKRQRYSQQQPLEVHDDEARYEPQMPLEEGYPERYQPRVVRQERVVGYERADDYRPHHGEEPILVTSPRYERLYYDEYRAAHPPSSFPAGAESAQYVPREVRTVRPASRILEPPHEEVATYYRDTRAVSRMSVRPPAYPERSQSPVGYERPPVAMPPPRAPPRRIIVDAYGREYLEPARPATIIREEVVAEPRGPYERVLPPRAVSRRVDLLDDDAVLYHTGSPAYAAPRRVVTQPDSPYREGAGPSNAMAPPPSEYLPSRARASTTRPAVESSRYDPPSAYERIPAPIDDRPPPREYFRAASARPADGVTRYEVPVAYERRLGPDDAIPMSARDYAHPHPPPPLRPASVRPGAEATARHEGPRDYGMRRAEYGPAVSAAPGASVGYQDVRREAMPPPPPAGRAYSAMPGEGPPPQAIHREYVAQGPHQPVERYYGRPPPSAREDEEVVFLDRPPLPRDGYREMR